jgi:choline dehydrogenase
MGQQIGLLSFGAVPVLLSLYKYCKRKTITRPDSGYDFIVVGGTLFQVKSVDLFSLPAGGSAGCALASRLSEDPTITVLLIEAGGDGLHLETRIPAAVGELQHTSCDWEDYCETQPQRACLEIIDGKSYWPRGRCLGGSSILNYMAYVRGNPEDYNSWAKILSDPKWGWESVKSIFQRMENCQTLHNSLPNPSSRGMNGPLHVSRKSPVNPLAQAFVTAATSLGYPIGDYNDGTNQECVSVLQTTTHSGRRYSSADAYIWPILSTRENLHVLLNTEVTRVLFSHSSSPSAVSSPHTSPLLLDPPHTSPTLRTQGVEYFNSMTKQLEQIYCHREVILSASAVGSPKLLLLSGIGPAPELQSLGVPCLLHLPEVGKNLQDHVGIGTVVNGSDRANSSGESSSGSRSQPNDIGTVNQRKGKSLLALLEWLFYGTGVLASSAYDTTLFLRSGLNNQMPFPDLQLGTLSSTPLPPSPLCANSALIAPCQGMVAALFPREFWIKNARFEPRKMIPEEMMEDNAQGFLLLSILLHPFSRGSVTLRSSNPFDKPVIQPGYFSDEGEKDLTTLATGALENVKIAQEMGSRI